MKSKNEIIGFGQKPQIEVFQKASKEFKQSPEFSYEKTFEQIWNKIESKIDIDLNKKGRNYVILPILKKAKITTWKQIEDEIELIDMKKSNFNYATRQAVVHFHTLIVNEYINTKYKK